MGYGQGYVPASEATMSDYKPGPAAAGSEKVRRSTTERLKWINKNRFNLKRLSLVALTLGLTAVAAFGDFDKDGVSNIEEALGKLNSGGSGADETVQASTTSGPTDAPVTPPTETAPAEPPAAEGRGKETQPTEVAPPISEPVKYTLTDGDGITQGIEKLRDNWPEGKAMPEWLKDLDSKEKLAAWAENKVHWYAPGEEKDSVIMHKGDVLSIDAQGYLSVHNADGSLEARTDVLGRAGPEALGTREFSDTVPTRGAPETPLEIIPAEYSDEERATLLSSAAKLGPSLEIGDFATKENEFEPGSEEYRAWEYIKGFLEKHSIHLGDGWRTSSMDPTDFLKHIGVIR